MYAIYGNIYHQYTPNVSIYIPYMVDIHDAIINNGGIKMNQPAIMRIFKCTFCVSKHAGSWVLPKLHAVHI
jgi:hypothetical protein